MGWMLENWAQPPNLSHGFNDLSGWKRKYGKTMNRRKIWHTAEPCNKSSTATSNQQLHGESSERIRLHSKPPSTWTPFDSLQAWWLQGLSSPKTAYPQMFAWNMAIWPSFSGVTPRFPPFFAPQRGPSTAMAPWTSRSTSSRPAATCWTPPEVPLSTAWRRRSRARWKRWGAWDRCRWEGLLGNASYIVGIWW